MFGEVGRGGEGGLGDQYLDILGMTTEDSNMENTSTTWMGAMVGIQQAHNCRKFLKKKL